ncbi:hypothetical protein EJV46_07810 [Roseococcus sp. SYP-B2431]|uniref:hypothetical protein n=1 Tax=Roseococcus sp. SYP-B2431 TaxID=2496640 RepID=UPI001039016C|nr:hypothetical protein [Roseococcus sp. SYP-B2431]TCI00525.1 hypothetical protein EJV46_07810 [Roseococcus sp. SYP-B2431]
MEVLDGRLTARNRPALMQRLQKVGSPTEVDLDGYDRFVVIGLELSLGVCASIFSKYRCYRHYISDQDFDANVTQLVSDSVFQMALKGLISSTGSIRIVDRLRTATSKPIYIVPQPNPLENFKTIKPETDRQRRAFSKWHPMFPASITNELYQEFCWAATSIAKSHGSVFTEQPAATLNDSFTKSKYGRNKLGDIRHMNAEFGAVCLVDLVAGIAKIEGNHLSNA